MIRLAFNATPVLSSLTGIGNYIIHLGRALAAHRVLHLAALGVLLAAAAAGSAGLTRAAAALGLAAATVFAAFFVAVMLRLRSSGSSGRPDVLQPTN